MFFFLPPVSSIAFSLFACVKLDEPADAASIVPGSRPATVGWYFMHDLKQECFSITDGWHLPLALGLGVPLTVLVLAVPVSIVAVMLHNWGQLRDAEFLQHYYFLVQHYNPAYYWYEAVVTCQTLVLVCLSVFGYMIGPQWQALAMNLVIIASGLMLQFLKPLRHREAKHVALCSKVCLCLIIMSYSADLCSV